MPWRRKTEAGEAEEVLRSLPVGVKRINVWRYGDLLCSKKVAILLLRSMVCFCGGLDGIFDLIMFYEIKC